MVKKRIASASLKKELAEWRDSMGLNQYQAAELLDVPFRTYLGWESGRKVPRPHMAKLALAYILSGKRK